jgi:hypothetical protein
MSVIAPKTMLGTTFEIVAGKPLDGVKNSKQFCSLRLCRLTTQGSGIAIRSNQCHPVKGYEEGKNQCINKENLRGWGA